MIVKNYVQRVNVLDSAQQPDNIIIPYGFIITPICFRVELPFRIDNDCTIDKARPEEIRWIKELLNKFNAPNNAGYSPTIWYEYENLRADDDRFTQDQLIPLSEHEWRYFVVRINSQEALHQLHLASFVSKLPLRINYLTLWHDGLGGYHPDKLYKYFRQDRIPRALQADLDMCEDLRKVFKQWKATTGKTEDEQDFFQISRAVQMLESLLSFQSDSAFRFMGLFSIIEMLITHTPHDRGDSTSHQLRTKMALLSRRFIEPIDFSKYFGTTSHKKVWDALYAYRSAIAHGGDLQLKLKELKIIKNHDHAEKFLNVAVVCLLRNSLEEPYLYKDLRAC
jgi:hypothetical protein